MNKTVTIGIPTYNRKDLLQIMAASLYESDLLINHHIRIYDDGSTEYGVYELSEMFPTAVSIMKNKVNLKADRNIYQMYSDFIKTQDDYFFNADSDIIFNKGWLTKSMELLTKTKGVLSLFNSNGHREYEAVDYDLAIKKTTGSAGTLFTKERLQEMLAHFDSMDMVKGFDWQWSEYFTDNNIPIFCARESLIQHIGYKGQNAGYSFDFGRNYKINTVKDGQIINDILEKYIDTVRELEIKRNRIDREKENLDNNLIYHLKRCIKILAKLMISQRPNSESAIPERKILKPKSLYLWTKT
ncbi:MAG: glycosyltransferase family 2 protein [Spirochaetaceae bacterium]|jgi:glycosyltransferase involved in cell wall biosynthesis|nr:glycosyltransferase family 2 protein [Spirochaetaceae bacterium]